MVGKPSAAYYRMVLADLQLPPHRVAMIGDDILADVRGAEMVGVQGWACQDRALPPRRPAAGHLAPPPGSITDIHLRLTADCRSRRLN